jgi:hypothetical protein
MCVLCGLLCDCWKNFNWIPAEGCFRVRWSFLNSFNRFSVAKYMNEEGNRPFVELAEIGEPKEGKK